MNHTTTVPAAPHTDERAPLAAFFLKAGVNWLYFFTIGWILAAMHDFRLDHVITRLLRLTGANRDIRFQSLEEISAPIRENTKALWSRMASAAYQTRPQYVRSIRQAGGSHGATPRASGRQSGKRRVHGSGAKKPAADPNGGDGESQRHSSSFPSPRCQHHNNQRIATRSIALIAGGAA
ncbi:hypothetical protein HFV00_00485 [Acidithiobacillus sp. VAN18-4]|nr:hypothetical protein [Acidithiobacillus sp. VAN18-4]